MDERNNYANRFKVRIEGTRFNDTVKRIGSIYGGMFEADASLLRDEYWYYTNINKETLNNSILVELVE